MVIISLYNLKGGVGKTASCVNFAYQAAKDGYKTLLWDLDPQGAASFYYKAQPNSKGSAKKIIEHSLSLEAAIMQTDYPNLDVIPADISARKMDILLDDYNASKKHLKSLLKGVANTYDFVFIDCPAGFSVLADNIFYASDVVLMPVVPTTLSIRTYDIVKEYFENKDTETDKLMCFFSMVDIRKKMHQDMMTQLSKDNRFFEYYIPYLSDIEKMGTRNAPIGAFAASSYAATCYRALWNEIKEGVLE
ncbi:MAG: ParA family protein [Bacteroidota bacterium]